MSNMIICRYSFPVHYNVIMFVIEFIEIKVKAFIVIFMGEVLNKRTVNLRANLLLNPC